MSQRRHTKKESKRAKPVQPAQVATPAEEIETVDYDELSDGLDDRSKARLKRATQRMFKYSRQLTDAQALVKLSRAKMNQAEKTVLEIIDLMNDPDVGYLARDQTDESRSVLSLQRKVYTRKLAINEKTIRAALSESFQNPAEVDELVAKIKSKQATKQVTKVVRKKRKEDQDIDQDVEHI
jgi:ABC-type nitrate/sulfonate/bicarbonate transport system substrate-binding protein